MDECLFCNIVSGKVPGSIVYEDEQFIAFKDIYPKAETHLLVIPKQHFQDLPELADQDHELTAALMQCVVKVARQQHLGSGYRTIINTGKGGGQIIFHLHAHILAGNNLPGF
jgi:histidine triad (HIT) family protein